MTGEANQPWWASGGDPAEGVAADEDPVERYRESRRGGPGPAGRPWWEEAAEGLYRAVQRAGAQRRGESPGEHAHGPAIAGGDDVCQVCPICIALRSLDTARPELVAHLGEAVRHLSLAAKAFADAQADATGADAEDLERIEVDDR